MSEPVQQVSAAARRPHADNVVLLLSFVLAVLSQWLDPVINRDGMYYVDLARNVATQGMSAAAAYDWPFLPLLLGQVAGLLSVDALLVAKVYAVVCGALLPFLLFGLLRQYDRLHPVLAALVALGLPFVAGYMDYITRDIGAWVALLVVMRLSLVWREQGGLLMLVTLLLFAALAFLMRTEMALLLLLVVYLPLERRRRRQGRWLARSRLANIAMAMTALAALLPAAWFALERVAVYRNAIARSPDMHTFPEFVSRLAPDVNPFLVGDLALVMASGLVVLVLVQLAGLLGLYLLPLLVGLRSGSVRAVVNRDGGVSLLLGTAFLLVVLAFVFVMQFVVGRYLVPAALMLAPLVYVGLVSWYGQQARRWPLTLFLVVAVAAGLRGYLSPDLGKRYIIEAGDWVAAHHDELAPVHFNDARVAFYAGERYDPRTFKPLEEAPGAGVRTLVLTFSDPQQVDQLQRGAGLAGEFVNLLYRVENNDGRGVIVLGR